MSKFIDTFKIWHIKNNFIRRTLLIVIVAFAVPMLVILSVVEATCKALICFCMFIMECHDEMNIQWKGLTVSIKSCWRGEV